MSTGALGQGLSFACGIMAASRRAGTASRVFAVLGDGECTKDQVCERPFPPPATACAT